MDKPTVDIDLETYTELANDSILLQMLLNALMDSAKLSYDGENLRFGGDNLEPIVKGIIPETYAHTFGQLKMERNEKETGRNENELNQA